MNTTLTEEDRITLLEINRKIGEAELRSDEKFLKQVLAEDLQFRRASGAVVDRDTYFKGVADPANTYAYSHSDDFQLFGVGDSVVVGLLVWAKGVRGKGTPEPKPFSAVYRNIRIFHRDSTAAHGWLCNFWFNDQIAM